MSKGWLENLFRPLVIGVMLACVVFSFVELAHIVLPKWQATYLVIGSVLVAFEANYSYRLLQAQQVHGADRWKFRAIELVALLFLFKAASFIGQRWQDVLAEVSTWAPNPLNLLNWETLASAAAVLVTWEMASATTRDLERMADPPEVRRWENPPVESLTARFFWGGLLLLIATGLARLGISEVLNLAHPPVPGLMLNALVYFTLGLVMLGQVRLNSLLNQWQADNVPVGQHLASRWVRYSLAFVGLAALVAFLLPTYYTAGLLETVSALVGLILATLSFLGMVLLTALTIPLAWLTWLVSKLFGGGAPALPPAAQAPQPQLAGGSGGIYPDWFVIFRSLYFWSVLLGMIYYVVRSYLRDHPEIAQALGAFRPVGLLGRLWAALRSRIGGWAAKARQNLPRRLLPDWRWRRPKQTPGTLHRIRLRGRSARERIFYFYLSILERAGQQGVPRQGTQTPYEYDSALRPRLPEAQEEMARLTQEFVEARYSRHAVEEVHASQARNHWQRVRAALRTLRNK